MEAQLKLTQALKVLTLGYIIGAVVGAMLVFIIFDCAHAQSYVPGQGGLYRQPNQYDSGGMTPTPNGPVYDYGVPKYQAPAPPTVPPILWYEYGTQQRHAQIRQRAEVQALTEQLKRRRAETCAEIEKLNQLKRMMGIEGEEQHC